MTCSVAWSTLWPSLDLKRELSPQSAERCFARCKDASSSYEGIDSTLPLLRSMATNKRTALQVMADLSDLETAANENHRLYALERAGMVCLLSEGVLDT